MIHYAQNKVIGKDNLTFHKMDATCFDVATQFDVVIMTGNAYQAFLLDTDLSAMLENIRHHMHSESVFVFVFDTRLPCAEHLGTTEDYEPWDQYVGMRGEVCVLGKQSRHHELTNTMVHHVVRHYDNGEVYNSVIELKYRSVDEIRAQLHQSKLEIVACYADWERSGFCEASQNMVVVAKARKE